MRRRFEVEHDIGVPPWLGHGAPAFAAGAATSAFPGVMDLLGSKQAMSKLYWRCFSYVKKNDPRWRLCPLANLLISFDVFGEEDVSRRDYRDGLVYRDDVHHFHELYMAIHADTSKRFSGGVDGTRARGPRDRGRPRGDGCTLSKSDARPTVVSGASDARGVGGPRDAGRGGSSSSSTGPF